MAEIKLIIEMDGQQTVVNVTDQVSKALKGMGDETQQADKKVNTLKSTFKDMLGTMRDINQATELVKKGIRGIQAGFDFVKAGAFAAEQKEALGELGKQYQLTADEIIMQVKRASGGIVAEGVIIQNANRALTLGLKPDAIVQFAKIARASAKSTGIEFEQAFNSITLGVARQSKLLLDNLGIIIDVGAANEEYAAQLGIAADELTEVQRQQAFTNAAMEQGNEIVERLGDNFGELADDVRKTETAWTGLVSATQEAVAFRIEETGALDVAITGLDALAGRISKVNRTRMVAAQTNKILSLSEDELLDFVRRNGEEAQKLADAWQRSLDTGEELARFNGRSMPDAMQRGIDAISAQQKNLAQNRKAWEQLTGRIFKNNTALAKARDLFVGARKAAGSGVDFIMRVKTKLFGFAAPLLSFLGFKTPGAEPPPPTGGTGGAAKEIETQLEKSLKRLEAITSRFANVGVTGFGKVRNEIEEIESSLSRAERNSFEFTLAFDRAVEAIERAELVKSFEKNMRVVSTINNSIIDDLTKLERQIVSVENAIATAAILSDQESIDMGLQALNILQQTIVLKQTELEIDRQRAEAAQREFEAQVAMRFGGVADDPGALIAGGTVAGTDLEALQLSEDQKFEILNMAFAREFELRQAHAQAVMELTSMTQNQLGNVVSGSFMLIANATASLVSGQKVAAKEFGKAMLEMSATAILAIGQQAAVKAVFALGEGLLFKDPSAFAAAKVYGAAAALALAAGGALKGAAAGISTGGGAAGGGAAGGGGPAGGGGISPPPQPLPADQPQGGFVINVIAQGDILDLNQTIENNILPAIAESIGRGNLGSAEFNVFARRE